MLQQRSRQLHSFHLYAMRKKSSKNLVLRSSIASHWAHWLMLVSLLLYEPHVACGQKTKDPALIEEYCKNFTHGSPALAQFYSPMYPRAYPEDINCFRTITAEFGYFVRIDFRDMFRIEPANNEQSCEYDYLEIRDGDQGYAPLIGK